MTTMMMMTTGGAGILAVAFVVTSALRRAPASLRHLIWLAALSAILTLPLLESTGLAVEVEVPSAWLATGGEASAPQATPAEQETVVRVRAEGRPPRIETSIVDETEPALTRRSAEEGTATDGRVAAPLPGAAEGPAAPTTVALTTSLASWIWAGGVLVLLLGTLGSHVQAWRLTARSVVPAPAAVHRRFDRLRSGLGIDRHVDLVVSSRIRVPATWGLVRPTVVLPEDYVDWSAETLDRVLLHELAHVGRGDCAAHLVGEIARAVHWPNPLAWLAVRRLRAESERASDDRVLGFIDLPSDYARDLVAMVRASRRGAPLPGPALSMASPLGVSSRVRAILDPAQRRGPVAKPAAVVVALVALSLASTATIVTPVAVAEEAPPIVDATPAAAPESQEVHCVFRGDERRSTSMNVDDDELRIRWETDDCRVDIDMEGEVEFSPDDTDIVAMGSGALFEIEERVGSSTRRARLEGSSGGTVERRYWEDGDEIAWGPEARQWLASILPELFRHTTINAEARVRRMLEQGGPDRVFQEVELIRSDHVRSTYLELMMELADLGDSDYVRVIDATAGIDSDHTSGELLLRVVETAGLRPSFQDPLLRASEGIDSDHERTRVLQTLLESPLSPEQLDAVLRSASSIDSDHNLGELLSVIARERRLTDAGRASFLDALRSIDSDHTHATVVEAFLDAGPLSDAELAQVLAMTDGIGSDHQRGAILQRVAAEYALTGVQATAYLESAAMLGSDHETGRVAAAVLERSQLSSAQVDMVLRITDRVGSDHERGQIIQTLIHRRDLSPAEVSGLLEVARGIGSDHNLAETLSTLVDEQDLKAAGVEGVLATLRGVGSDHQRISVMLRVAERFELAGRALEIYESLANDLSSRDRERVLAAISR